MALAHVDWIGTLCTALGLACVTQLIIGGLLSFTLAEFLAFTGSLYATGVTLLAGFVTLPTTIQMRTSRMLPGMDKVYGYTTCYSKLAISVSLSIHFIATILSAIAIFNTTHFGNNFLTIMKKYHYEQNAKSMVDNIQWALQCCGSNNYKDWFEFDWMGNKIAKSKKYRKKSIYELLLMEDTKFLTADTRMKGNDAVPFSCCTRKIKAACTHYQLRNAGTSTINMQGCTKKLKETMQSLLIFELCLNGISIALEVVILILLRVDNEVEAYKKSTAIKQRSSTSLDRFTNEVNSVAEIIPTTHHEIRIKKQIVLKT